MDHQLAGKSVAILVANGFDEIEMTEAHRALIKAGATVRTVSTEQGLVNGWHGASWGHYFPVDLPLGEVLGSDFDALLLPGGSRGVAKLGQSAHTRRIVGHFLDAGKPIAAITDGVALMAVPGKLRRRSVAVTSAETGEAITAAGGQVVDADLVTDDNTVSIRSTAEVENFVAEMLKLFAGGETVAQAA